MDKASGKLTVYFEEPFSAHRLVRSAKAKAAKRSAESILIEVMQNVKKPTAARR